MTAPQAHEPKSTLRRDMMVASVCGVVVAAMIGLSYASVPFYNWFCRTTGYGGTTQVSEKAPDQVLGRTIAIRFDSNVAPGLPWKFEPEENVIKVRIGEVTTAHYKVTNMAAREITAQAGYNVSPPQIGGYFNKINCFCFTQQTMKPGETREMTVVFYVDPSIAKDSDQDNLNTITLSYTFYRIPNPEKPVAQVPQADPKSSKL
jgi:cytochrome c oxidase assembly protein subunit 11